jgi:hypothetical protein
MQNWGFGVLKAKMLRQEDFGKLDANCHWEMILLVVLDC